MSLALFIIAQNQSQKILELPKLNPIVQTAKPQVLGEATLARGNGAESLGPIKQISQPDIREINAKSFIIFDLGNGQTLLEKNAAERLEIASLTKLMTGWVAYQNVDLNQNFTVTAADTLSTSPFLGLQPGDKVKALDVFNAMLIGSCNDAALALGNYVSNQTGKSFVSLMNTEAQKLGMVNSNFSNPLGFDSRHNYSTAEDLKFLIRSTQQLAVFTDLGRRSNYDFVGSKNKTYSTIATNNLLKGHSDIQAVKTGYTETAGGAMATKIEVNGHAIVILVLDSQTRETDTLNLKDEVFKNFY